jgi:hypothetical protein
MARLGGFRRRVTQGGIEPAGEKKAARAQTSGREVRFFSVVRMAVIVINPWREALHSEDLSQKKLK